MRPMAEYPLHIRVKLKELNEEVKHWKRWSYGLALLAFTGWLAAVVMAGKLILSREGF